MIDTDKYAEVIDDDGYFCEDKIADLLAEVKRLNRRLVEADCLIDTLQTMADNQAEEVKRLRESNEFLMRIDREATKENLKVYEENDNLMKLCIERYAEIKRLRKQLDSLREFCHKEDYDIYNWEVKNLGDEQ
tara:strand:+ start:3952 stop:4350 length:399 start_codon:yes stop_codon:yes gene_type:complete